METTKFECLRCGNCCRNFRSSDHIEFSGPGFTGEKTFMLNEQSLMLFDWEADDFRKKLRPGRKVVPTTVLFDLKGSQTIVLHYTIDSGECPYHSDAGCGIYESRPWICRQFPCLHNLSPLIKNESNRIVFLRNGMCGFESGDMFFKSIENQPLQLHSLLEERYGEAYHYNLALTVIAINKSRILKRLEEEGKIKIARKGYDPANLLKRIESSKHVGFNDICKSMAGIDIRDTFRLDEWRQFLKQKWG